MDDKSGSNHVTQGSKSMINCSAQTLLGPTCLKLGGAHIFPAFAADAKFRAQALQSHMLTLALFAELSDARIHFWGLLKVTNAPGLVLNDFDKVFTSGTGIRYLSKKKGLRNPVS